MLPTVYGSRSPVRLALSRDRQQLIEKMESADSIVLLYDVTRPETLMRLDTFWLPLMERNAQARLISIVRGVSSV